MINSTRRRFLMFFGTLGLAGTSAVGTSLVLRAAASVEDVVRKRLYYLAFSEGAVEQFAEAFRAAAPERESLVSRALADPTKAFPALLQQGGGRALKLAEERIATEFLLSTDFFQNGADVSRPVAFLAYADPYSTGCSNPLVKFA